MGDFGDFSGFVPPELSPGQILNQSLGEAGSEVAHSSPILGFLLGTLGKVLGGGGLEDQLGQDPFTGNSYADSFTMQAYGSLDPYTTAMGSITDVISIGDVLPAADTFTLSDVQSDFAAPATEDESQLASNERWVQDPNTGFWVPAVLVPNAPSFELGLPSSSGYLSPPVVSDSPAANLGQPLPSPPVSQPSTTTQQPASVPSSVVSPLASDYNPAADQGDVPQVFVPTYAYPPIDTWPTAGPSAPPVTSPPSMLTPQPNTVEPSAPDIPQITQAPRDFWSTWFGDATQTEWAISAPDRRLIQPITHYDAGNRALNFVLNKIVFPWRNVLGSFENIPYGVILGLSDLDERLGQDPDWGLTYQAFSLEPMGIGQVGRLIGPTEELFSGFSETSQLSALAPVAEQAATEDLPVLGLSRQSAELPPLAGDLEDVITLNQLFGQKVQQNAALLRNATGIEKDSLLRQWLSVAEYASYARGEMQAANTGKAIERMVATDLALDSRTSPYFVYVGGANQPDFYGVGRLQGFFWDVTTLADKAAHEYEGFRWYASRMFVWAY